MVGVLLTNLKEVFSRCKIVKHDCPPDFVEELLLEVLALVQELLDLLGLFWEHILLALFVVVSDFVDLLNQGWVLNLPLLIVLLLEQLVLFSLECFMGLLVFEIGSLDEQICFLETCSSLFPLILELGIEAIIYHVPLM